MMPATVSEVGFAPRIGRSVSLDHAAEILGVSRARMEPVYRGNEFVPRLMLPLSLSYDHRAIDGADGARFCPGRPKLGRGHAVAQPRSVT